MSDGSSTPRPTEPGSRRPNPGGRDRSPSPATGAPIASPPPGATPPSAAQPPAGGDYDETIVARSQIAVSVGIAVVLAVVLLAIRTSLWPFALIVLVMVGGVGVYLAGISVVATRNFVEIGQGRREREPRYISNDEIVDASCADLTWSQVFGLGLPRADKNTRFTVRPGATLVLELRSGEVVRVSTPDPARALAALGRTPA